LVKCGKISFLASGHEIHPHFPEVDEFETVDPALRMALARLAALVEAD